MKYLRIANKGLADPDALTILGVSTSRHQNLIGQFGTGSKFSIALLLRNQLSPVIYIGNLCLSFGTTPKVIDGQSQQIVTVKYSGKNLQGRNINRSERLGYTTGLGELDWTDLTMAAREFTSNAIDGALRSGHSLDDVLVELTDTMRAKSGWTQVFLPVSPEILQFFAELPVRFLHFHPLHKTSLSAKMLQKINPQSNQIRIYKKGVLVATVNHEHGSRFDYNLGDELRLDESRNAKDWDVKTACARAWAMASKEQKESLLLALSHNPQTWESTLDADYMDGSYYLSYNQQVQCRQAWKEAFEEVHGEKAVIVTNQFSGNYAKRKGFKSVVGSQQLKRIAKNSGVKNEDSVLTGIERSGRVVCDATPEMHKAVDDWWRLILAAKMNNGREKPTVKAFQQPMEAGTQTWGLADLENDTIYFHLELSGLALRKVALEELAHHCSGATDMSRDFQDWLCRLITHLTFSCKINNSEIKK